MLCILTAYPLSVIVDVLDSQWGEHHTNRLSWHAHLRTV